MPAFLVRGLTDLALPADYDGESSARRTALVSVNGVLVNPISDSVITEGGFLSGCRTIHSATNSWVVRAIRGWLPLPITAHRICAADAGRTSYPRTWMLDDISDWFDAGAPALPCCAGVGILFAEDNDPCCPRWEWADRPPSGQLNAQVAWRADGTIAYASTSGSGRLWHGGDWYADESAFSQTATPTWRWEQTGLIDTMIHHLMGIAYDPARTTLHLHSDHNADDGSVCDCESIWRTATEGEAWYGNCTAGQTRVTPMRKPSMTSSADTTGASTNPGPRDTFRQRAYATSSATLSMTTTNSRCKRDSKPMPCTAWLRGAITRGRR